MIPNSVMQEIGAYGFGEIDHICWNIKANMHDSSKTTENLETSLRFWEMWEKKMNHSIILLVSHYLLENKDMWVNYPRYSEWGTHSE